MDALTLETVVGDLRPPAREARRFEVTGIVQGVGFRPFVHRLATGLGLDGVVGNDMARVFIEVAGSVPALDAFGEQLRTEAPTLSMIDQITIVAPSEGHAARRAVGAGFGIVASEPTSAPTTGDPTTGTRTFVSPDVAVCDDCLAEMQDPTDRRFGHPFITCTNCGPRFTITRALPYDRPNTTMAEFDMCPTCTNEYRDPSDRRFHAQPIGCHDCGPTLGFRRSNRSAAVAVSDAVAGATSDDCLAAAVHVLRTGEILALKGLGGYHLATSATSDGAVRRLRDRKHRPDKPFAVMVADRAMAAEIAIVTDHEAEVLASPARPIVLCRARADSPLSPLVAPGNPLIGIVLPYTPVHHLLFAPDRDGDALGPLVMTSGNVAGEPLCYRDDRAEEMLGSMADAFLTNDRPIHLPCDDSVVRVVAGEVLPLRRARGFAPMPLTLPATGQLPSVLAVGGELKNAFCFTSGPHAWMSQHIGDMENLATLEAFAASVQQFGEFYDLDPDVVAADTHPRYLSSGWARSNHGDRLVEVQHHHAHVAAVMAEHGLDPHEPILGLAFDGTGDGTDGTIWGGELLVATATGAQRLAHLRHVPLPGGDEAIRHPWRVALAHLWAAGLPWDESIPSVGAAADGERSLLQQQLDRDLGCVPTSSMGRFFDAISSLIGLRHEISYEAQAAIELEIAASTWRGRAPHYRFELDDPTPLLASVCADVSRGVAAGAIAKAAHVAVADGVSSLVIDEAARLGITNVALTGGVFQNVYLSRLMSDRLSEAGLAPLTHRLVPPNDGGLALGQAFVAAHRFALDPAPTSARADAVKE